MHDAGVSLNKQSRPFIFSTLWNVKAASRHVATSQENKYKNIHNMALHEQKLAELYRAAAETVQDRSLALIPNEAEIARKKYYDINAKHKDLLLKFTKLYSDHAAIAAENKELRHTIDTLSTGKLELSEAHGRLLGQFAELEKVHKELERKHAELANKYQQLNSSYDEVCRHNLEYMTQLVLKRTESVSSDGFEHVTYEDTDH